MTAYNLGGGNGQSSVRVDLSVLGLDAAPPVASSPPAALRQVRVEDDALVLDLEIAPLSPVIVEIGTDIATGNG